MLTLGLIPEDQGFWRTRGLARALSVNLTEAIAVGALDRRGYVAMVGRCDSCPHGTACADWVSARPGGADAAPEFCANAPVLGALRARR